MSKASEACKIREETGVGLVEAAKIIRGEELFQMLRDAEHISQVKAVIALIINDLYPKRPKL